VSTEGVTNAVVVRGDVLQMEDRQENAMIFREGLRL